MSWVLLVVAGLLEVVWAALLPATSGFSRPVPTAGFLLALAASMFLLARASTTIPLGTAYSVWVGIGASARRSSASPSMATRSRRRASGS